MRRFVACVTAKGSKTSLMLSQSKHAGVLVQAAVKAPSLTACASSRAYASALLPPTRKVPTP
jgi:hypothetical protein